MKFLILCLLISSQVFAGLNLQEVYNSGERLLERDQITNLELQSLSAIASGLFFEANKERANPQSKELAQKLMDKMKERFPSCVRTEKLDDVIYVDKEALNKKHTARAGAQISLLVVGSAVLLMSFPGALIVGGAAVVVGASNTFFTLSSLDLYDSVLKEGTRLYQAEELQQHLEDGFATCVR